MNVRLAPVATAEFRVIAARLASANPSAGRKFEAAVRRTAALLSAQPRIGVEYPHTNPSLGEVRYLVAVRFPSYLLLYEVTDVEVVVLHVAHARQDLDALLSRD